MENIENARLLVEVAHMYYEENLKQSEIAKKLNISRSLVSRYLTKAREEKIVQFVIHDDFFNPHYKLEQNIKEKFKLKNVICINSNNDRIIQKQRVAEAASKYLIQQIKKDTIVTVAGGTTINKIAESIVPSTAVSGPTFVSLVGGIEEEHRNIQSNVVCDELALKTNGISKPLYAPVIVDSVEAKEIFVKQTYIKKVINLAKKADIALLGIGGHPENSSIANAYKNHLKTQKDFDTSTIVGDFCYKFIDEFGNLVDCEWNKRLISLDIEYIKEIPNVIGIVEGIDKKQSILAVLNAELIDSLIIDENTATEILNT